MSIKTIDRIAAAQFDGLLAAAAVLRNRNRRGRGSKDPKAENRALDKLFEAFEQAALIYFEGGKKLIQAPDACKRANDYFQVLSNLADHLQLLTDLARPNLEELLDKDDSSTSPKKALPKNRTLIDK